MLKITFKALIVFFGLLTMFPAKAEKLVPMVNQGTPYEDVKKILIADGWKPFNNHRVSWSSLYAQELYTQGMTEVVDCISMELDGCTFHYTKSMQTLEVRTITRQLKLDKMEMLKKH